MNAIRWMLIVVVLCPISVKQVYQPIELIGRDTSLRNTDMRVNLDDDLDDDIYIPVGKKISIVVDHSIEVTERLDSGWSTYHKKPKKHLVFHFNWTLAAKPQPFALIAVLGVTGKRDFPNVPFVYPDKFPTNFQNYLPGWGYFNRETIEKETGKLLMLDMDFGRDCSLNCPTCFRRHKNFEHGKPDLTFEETLEVIHQARELGLREVKFLGAGEIFEDPSFLKLLFFLDEQGIFSSVFTKGHPIADDQIVARVNVAYGITSSEQLIQTLIKRKVSLIIGFNAIDAEKQDRFVSRKGHTILRNRAIELLAEAGFNKSNPTRMSLGCSPTTRENIDDMTEVYQWARRRNLHTVICPTMISGRASSDKAWRSITPSEEELVNLYTGIYMFNLRHGIQTLEELRRDGISAYAGVQPCNQVSCGLYIALDGTVLLCPGDDTKIVGDVRKEALKDIWEKSVNYRRAGTYNCYCPAKVSRSIPTHLFKRVLANLEAMG